MYVCPAVSAVYRYVPLWPESKGQLPRHRTMTCSLYSLRSVESYASFAPLAYVMNAVPPPEGKGQLGHGAVTANTPSPVASPRSRIVKAEPAPVVPEAEADAENC